MKYLAPFIIIAFCFIGLAIGMIIANKPFRRCCEQDKSKDCSCDDKEESCHKDKH